MGYESISGWVGYGKIEEKQAGIGMRWVGGWVGGWDGPHEGEFLVFSPHLLVDC